MKITREKKPWEKSSSVISMCNRYYCELTVRDCGNDGKNQWGRKWQTIAEGKAHRSLEVVPGMLGCLVMTGVVHQNWVHNSGHLMFQLKINTWRYVRMYPDVHFLVNWKTLTVIWHFYSNQHSLMLETKWIFIHYHSNFVYFCIISCIYVKLIKAKIFY